MTVPLQFVAVRDIDGIVAIGRDDLVRYAGPGQVVASALCLRLFARAFADLSPDAPPNRDDIHVLVAFPGPGILDCVEMITRAVSRGRLNIDTRAGPAEAPPALAGRFYFEVSVGATARGYWLAEEFFTPQFVDQIRRHQDGAGTAAERADYLMAKHTLIGRLLGASDEDLFHSREVAAAGQILDPEISVVDHGTTLTIGYRDCVNFHGRTNIGGVALGLRLMQRAAADLSPDGPPDRAGISVRTAFPGLGVRDAVEMIARTTTRAAYYVDPEMAPDSAPDAAVGRFWFEVTIAGRSRAYVTAPGAVSEEFVALGRKSKQAPLSAAEDARWTELKEDLASRIMAAPPAAVLVPA